MKYFLLICFIAFLQQTNCNANNAIFRNSELTLFFPLFFDFMLFFVDHVQSQGFHPISSRENEEIRSICGKSRIIDESDDEDDEYDDEVEGSAGEFMNKVLLLFFIWPLWVSTSKSPIFRSYSEPHQIFFEKIGMFQTTRNDASVRPAVNLRRKVNSPGRESSFDLPTIDFAHWPWSLGDMRSQQGTACWMSRELLHFTLKKLYF